MRFRARAALAWWYVSALLAFLILFGVVMNHRDDHPRLVPTEASAPYFAATSPKGKHVTKSLAELGPMDEINHHVVFFNRVPHCGSETLVLLLQWLQGWNGFKHVRLKGGDRGSRMSRVQQEQLVDEIMTTMRNQAVPLTFDRYGYFVNFTSFGKQSPVYLNLVRDPTERFLSRSLGNKIGETQRRVRQIQKCISSKHLHDCIFDKKVPDLMVPYFCGHEKRCMNQNDIWALSRAKENIATYFPVVGVLEELNSTLELLENRLPYFFKGALNLYYKDILGPHRSKHPIIKESASENIRQYFKEKLASEYELYEWIRSRLFVQLQTIYGDHNGHR